jgi:uncharacterized protein
MNSADIQCLIAGLEGTPQLIETHISWVILVDDWAYKLKKPLQFSFLDFSDMEKRGLYCRKELELNCRLAPTVYLEVVPVYQSGASISWNDLGVDACVIDHALKMRRLDASMEMDRMLAAGKIGLTYMAVLADKIAAFHATATVISNPAQSSAESYQADFNDILGQSAVIADLLGAAAATRLARIVGISDRYLARHALLIAARLAGGMVRDVHGDLHAHNIFAYPDPIVFDCIEFNDHFRQIDVLNEVAFCCMDLEATGFDAHAAAFLDAYLHASGVVQDAGSTMLFLWFKCYRANVRTKVAALRASQAGPSTEITSELACYLDLMERYALALDDQDEKIT